MAEESRVEVALGGPGFDLVQRAANEMRRHQMVDRDAHVLVAVSGGPDSICLLDVLLRLAGTFELQVSVAHVDHGLDPDSAGVAARLGAACAEKGLEVHMVRAPDLAGPNLQSRARDFRYAFFATIAGQVGATRVATGHTLDDQVETLLARLIHGAGTQTLAAIRPVEGSRIRPLLSSRRSETRAYCVERSLAFFDDPSNQDERFERVAVRSTIVAAIEERWGEGAIRAIATSAARLREDADALAGVAGALADTMIERSSGGARVARGALNDLPRGLRRRVLESAVGRIRDRAGGIDAVLDALDRGATTGTRFSVAAGIEIAIEPDHVVVTRPPPEGGDGDGVPTRMAR